MNEMVSLDDSSLVVYEKGGKKLEIIVDPFKAFEYRRGASIPVEEVVVSPEIFRDARKGEREQESVVLRLLDVASIDKALPIILKQGRLQIPTKLRRRLVDEKVKQIISELSRVAIDVRTKAPVPPKRIELALEKVRVHVDPFIPVAEQLPEVIKALRNELPLKVEMKKVKCVFPVEIAGMKYGEIKRLKPQKEEWLPNGDLAVEFQVPVGVLEEFISKLNKISSSIKVDIK